LQRASRMVLEDLEMGGQVLRKGQRVWLMTGAANRDPAQFREPDRLDVRREEPRHLSFGMGPHYCVGAALARMQAQEVFGALVRRFPHMRLEEGTPLQWLDTVVFRGVHSLPVILGPAVS
jgi:cytochrome P450